MIDPATFVIFGGGGDLTRRKLLPALYNLHVDGQLPAALAIVGVGRKDFDDHTYRQFAREGVARHSRRPIDDALWDEFATRLFFVKSDLAEPHALTSLGARLDTIEHERKLPGNRVYYLATPPDLIAPIVEHLKRARFVGPADRGPYARVIIEKPIGLDLESARQINDAVAQVFAEHQTFRIDHYLGKETVQNILVLRFANSFFEPFFNQRYIDHVQITVAEEEGIGERASYYDHAGALRDIVQNHLLQVLALVAMEPPFSLDADVVRDERLEVIHSLRPLTGESVDRHVVRGQYEGYTREPGVDPQSRTETYVALQLFIDNWRWAGVPFFMRTGKKLPKRASEVFVQFKEVPPVLFNKDAKRPLEPNVLAIRIQPDEGFALRISSKVPGAGLTVTPVDMDFDYCSAFRKSSPEAYERLILDVLAGDTTLFMRRDAVEAAWRWITPILDRWKDPAAPPPAIYRPQTWGPPEADRLIERSGRSWRPV